MEEKIYVLKGHRRDSDQMHVIDIIDGLEEAQEFLLNLRAEMPHWFFWIDHEPRSKYDVQKGVPIEQLDVAAG